MSHDSQRCHFPRLSLSSSELWQQSLPQQVATAHKGVRSILESVCRGIQPHIPEALTVQARIHIVRNGSRADRQFVYFAGYVRCTRDELPPCMGQCWWA